MDPKTALHTAARRYCASRFSEWADIYSELQAKESNRENKFKHGWDYSPEEYGIFPRYRLAKAILIQVERLVPLQAHTFEYLQSQLLEGSGIAETRLCAELKNPMAQRALREEAEGYNVYISGLSTGDLADIAPLPFRRVLTRSQSDEIWGQLKTAWNIGPGYWFPLKEGPEPESVIAFHTDYFERMNGTGLLHKALRERQILNIFQLHESSPDEADYELSSRSSSLIIASAGNSTPRLHKSIGSFMRRTNRPSQWLETGSSKFSRMPGRTVCSVRTEAHTQRMIFEAPGSANE